MPCPLRRPRRGARGRRRPRAAGREPRGAAARRAPRRRAGPGRRRSRRHGPHRHRPHGNRPLPPRDVRRRARAAALPHRADRWVRPLLDLTAPRCARLGRRGVPWRDDASLQRRPRPRAQPHPLRRAAGARDPEPGRRGERRPRRRARHRRARAARWPRRRSPRRGGRQRRPDRLRSAHPALQRLALRDAAARAGVALGHLDVEALRRMPLVGVERRTLPRAATAERRRARLSFAPATPRRAPA